MVVIERREREDGDRWEKRKRRERPTKVSGGPFDFQERQFTVFFCCFFSFSRKWPPQGCLSASPCTPGSCPQQGAEECPKNQPEEAPSESCPTESPANLTAFNTNPKPNWQGHCPSLKSTIDPKPAYHQYPKKSRTVAFLICKMCVFTNGFIPHDCAVYTNSHKHTPLPFVCKGLALLSQI